MINKDTVILCEGNFVRLIRKENGWEYAERVNATEAAVIAAVTDDNKILLVEQFRPPLCSNVIELPAGLADGIGVREEIEDVAKRELYEETGYTAQEIMYLTKGPSSPGLSNEVFTLFLAKGLKKKGPGGGDKNEDIIIHEIDIKKADTWLRNRTDNGFPVDPKVYIGLYFISIRS